MTRLARAASVVACSVLVFSPAAAQADSYAVLFNGGCIDYLNYPLYYENTLRMYGLVTGELNFAAENVFVLASDGTDPAPDLSDGTSSDWTTALSAGSTVLSATRENLGSVLGGLGAGPADLVFLWTYDHGYGAVGEPETTGEEALYAWGHTIADDVLAGYVAGLGAGRQAFVFGQCFSGGMLDDLNVTAGTGRFGCAATNHYEYSWGDAFVSAFADGISDESLTTTHALYQHAYANDRFATGGEGPGGTWDKNVEHPWKVGDDLDLAAARWIGQGPARPWHDPANWAGLPAAGRTVRVAFDAAGDATVSTAGCQGGYLDVDYAAAVGPAACVRIVAGGELASTGQVIGSKAYGRVVQEGGSNTVAETIALAWRPGSQGVYELRGGTLSAASMILAGESIGSMLHSGGAASFGEALYVGQFPGASGAYHLGGTGRLSAPDEFIGVGGIGGLVQTGGTNEVGGTLGLGCAAGATGTYELHGGELSADVERVGDGGAGVFFQSGGLNTVGTLLVGSAGRYEFTGGTLQLTGGMTLCGELDLADSAAALAWDDVVVDFSPGRVLGAGSASLTMGPNSLLIVAPLFDPGAVFGSYSSAGLTHTAGTTLVVPAGKGFPGRGAINDHVRCEGTIAADPGGSLLLTAGVEVLGAGSVDLGSGTLTVEDDVSGVSGGRLDAWRESVGLTGAGRFVHDGGVNCVADLLLLGDGAGSAGTYELSGTGQLWPAAVYVGHRGTGTFVQTGGTHVVGGELTLGRCAGSAGSYAISRGTLAVADGVVLVGGDGDGTLRLDGGTVVADELSVSASGTFLADSTGGTLRVNRLTGLGAHPAFGGSLQLGHAGGAGACQYAIGPGEGLAVGRDLVVGYDAPATADQTGGTNSVAATLTLGCLAGGSGTYALRGGALTAGTLLVGDGGSGLLDWVAGTLTAEVIVVSEAGRFNLPGDWTFTGALEVNGGTVDLGAAGLVLDGGAAAYVRGGWLISGGQTVGQSGAAAVLHSGGVNAVAGNLCIGDGPGSQGTYRLSGEALLSAATEYVGWFGWGGVVQTGGTHTVSGYLVLGFDAGVEGTCQLGGGQFSCANEAIGAGGTGRFTQTGGTHAVAGIVEMGYARDAVGTFELAGGELAASEERMGRAGTGQFTQTGGVHTVSGAVCLGYLAGSHGRYSISGGTFSAGEIRVGEAGSGVLDLAGAAAEVTVTGLLRFGTDGALSALPGSRIHLSGADLEIHSAEPADLAGLGDVTFVIDGGSDLLSDLEVGGRNLGAEQAGWADNFALAGLEVGGQHGGQARLVDAFDNQPGWSGDEALYVGEIVFSLGGMLDLNGLRLYYLNGGAPKLLMYGDCSLDGKIDYLDLGIVAMNYSYLLRTWCDGDFNGDTLVNYVDMGMVATQYGAGTPPLPGGGMGLVPEPAALGLLALGAAALLLRRRPGRAV